MRRIINALAIGVLISSVAAQKQYIVDSNNGKGADFTTLAAALKVATHLDVLQLRKGWYTAPKIIDKAVTFQGTAGVRIQAPGGFATAFPIRIKNIPEGLSMSFRDLRLGPTLFGFTTVGTVYVDHVVGTVVFDNVRIDGLENSPAVFSKGSTHVVFRDSTVNGMVSSVDSRVLTEGGSFVGRDAVPISGRNVVADPAFLILRGELSLADSSVVGGQGAGGTWPRGPAHAIQVAGANLRIRGKDCKVTAGALSGFDQTAVLGDAASSLLLDTKSTVKGTGKGTAMKSFGSKSTKVLPVLRSSGLPVRGKDWTHTLRSPVGSNHMVFLSFPGPGTALPNNETFMLSPAIMPLFYAGVQFAGGETKISVRLKNDIIYTAFVFAIQGISVTATDAQLTSELVICKRAN